MERCEKITQCIACGCQDLILVLDLGKQPLANSFKRSVEEIEEYFPLAINRCENCSHVQLTHMVNPDLLFKDYLYVSGTSKIQLDYFNWFAEYTIKQTKERPESVLDIGCNDGSLLDVYKGLGINTYGIDPAENLFKDSSKKHKIACEYFNESTFDDGVAFDIITCLNAFAHNYNPLEFLKNAKKIMHRNSLLHITTSQSDMIINNEFDTIYHEHISFYNTRSMGILCDRAGLQLLRINNHPIHGNSYIFTIGLKHHFPENLYGNLVHEKLLGLHSPKTYEKYYKKCVNIIEGFRNTVEQIRRNGYTIIGYGAAAKGNTLLNAAGIGPDFIIDDNPLKQGLFSPGLSIPVYGIEYLDKYSEVDRVCFIPLAWNFFEGIRANIETKRKGKNDLFVRYFPEIVVENPDEVDYHPV